jgi:hypothetical protein
MPIFSRNSCCRRSGGVSINKFPSGNPIANPQRVRLFFGSSLVQTGQSQPIAGTPTLVPVPRKTKRPEISRLGGVRDTCKRAHW